VFASELLAATIDVPRLLRVRILLPRIAMFTTRAPVALALRRVASPRRVALLRSSMRAAALTIAACGRVAPPLEFVPRRVR
jgi:hypothetical protein